jgi:hypothetical protein
MYPDEEIKRAVNEAEWYKKYIKEEGNFIAISDIYSKLNEIVNALNELRPLIVLLTRDKSTLLQDIKNSNEDI